MQVPHQTCSIGAESSPSLNGFPAAWDRPWPPADRRQAHDRIFPELRTPDQGPAAVARSSGLHARVLAVTTPKVWPEPYPIGTHIRHCPVQAPSAFAVRRPPASNDQLTRRPSRAANAQPVRAALIGRLALVHAPHHYSSQGIEGWNREAAGSVRSGDSEQVISGTRQRPEHDCGVLAQ